MSIATQGWVYQTPLTFRGLCLPNAHRSDDPSGAEPNDDSGHNELCDLKRCRHEDTADCLHQAGYKDCLTTTEPVAEELFRMLSACLENETVSNDHCVPYKQGLRKHPATCRLRSQFLHAISNRHSISFSCRIHTLYGRFVVLRSSS